MSQILYLTNIQIDFGALQLLAGECERNGMRKPLIVTDPGVKAAGLLDRAVAAQLEQGAGLEETQRRVRLPAFRAWVGQGAVHARNVHKQYLAREADWLVAPR